MKGLRTPPLVGQADGSRSSYNYAAMKTIGWYKKNRWIK